MAPRVVPRCASTVPVMDEPFISHAPSSWPANVRELHSRLRTSPRQQGIYALERLPSPTCARLASTPQELSRPQAARPWRRTASATRLKPAGRLDLECRPVTTSEMEQHPGSVSVFVALTDHEDRPQGPAGRPAPSRCWSLRSATIWSMYGVGLAAAVTEALSQPGAWPLVLLAGLPWHCLAAGRRPIDVLRDYAARPGG